MGRANVTGARLDLAGTRSFTTAGAGQARRRALADYGMQWLESIWAEATAGAATPGVALAAVGSLARADAGPLSDYDLVLVHQSRAISGADLDALADRLWYPLWDSGVKLDHSVRTVTQCRAVAGSDLSAAVGLLDLRHVAGDPDVVAAARATVAHDWRAAARRRLPELIEAVAARHRRHGDLAQLLEPDLKEARGGLRDMSLLRALTAAWLADRPHGDVDAAYLRLLDVRDAIHVVTGRARDRLGREDHDAVAALLGHHDADAMLTDVSGAARVIAYSLEGTIRRASQAQRARTLRVGPRRPALRPMGYGLFLHDGEAVLGPGVDPKTDPTLVLRAALVAARAGVTLAPATLTNLAENGVALPVPWPEPALSLFGDLLATGPGLVAVWEGLDLAGIIERWIPQWRSVRSRPQRNAVHRHTVDRHSIEAVVRAGALVRDVHRPDLLLLAALLHDIGKVPGEADHSVRGAVVANEVLQRLGVRDDDRELVVRLVREHLTLIDLATRRDPTDPRTLAAVSEAVQGSAQTLELLRALTEADASAAGPAAWTDWRATLLDRLTVAARTYLTREEGTSGEPAPGSPQRERAWRGASQEEGVGTDIAGVVPTLVPPAIPRDPSVAAALDGTAPATDLVTREMLATISTGQPVVEVTSLGGAYRLTVCAADRIGLFADTAGLLAAAGFVVRSALLRTSQGVAADDWHVDSPDGDAPDPAALVRGLVRLAGGDRTPLAALQRRRRPSPTSSTRASSGSPGQARALVVSGASETATVVEVRASDRVGLLHDIGRSLAGEGVSVRSAHIATYAGQALDTFYLTQVDGTPLTPPQVARVVSLIIETCDG